MLSRDADNVQTTFSKLRFYVLVYSGALWPFYVFFGGSQGWENNCIRNELAGPNVSARLGEKLGKEAGKRK